MKQIYTGATQRSKLFTDIKQTVRPAHFIQLGVFILLILIPMSFHGKIFTIDHKEMSNVVIVNALSGSGSAILVKDKLLLTAAHVMDGMSIGDDVDVEFQDPNNPTKPHISLTAELVAIGNYFPQRNPAEDYALLQLRYRSAKNIAQPVTLTNANGVKVKDQITIEGYPCGSYSSTQGIVSNLQGGVTQIKELYVVDAKAWRGNSGGALFNSKNELIGIVIAIGAINGMNDGQTYALKVDKVRSALSAYGL